MKASELKGKSAKELSALLAGQRREQFKARLLKASGDVVKTDQFKRIRKTIARIETILKQIEGMA